ncbi:MBL fold metallo-hydrolase [Tabrizicola sp.]|jgi:glyoxylase-like metal-dependent hydrolase (beta-lactamase superfamily II)|uniref:MBL fold metallo-hydrolase n=1 Tax=Tabrizicola sp. TaxID=2005166 RepID=UPI000BD18EC8|nr:MBL fold metallo-hydrolase [Tabrizicola sp.]MBY0349605.1 MBL fold metallo-hydrolase [Tabrizicola sp.]MDK2775256.1 MBL fold metallo-hydrolase [Tabrizicola sp.]OYX19314.1 MAG: MBL fold metallo-hydrolase [Rhodobacterales bacterium 32-66-9]
MTSISRRQALFAAAALPFASALARPVGAQETMQGSGFAPWNRFKLGAFEVTTLLAGTRAGDKPQETFGTNATPDDFAALSAANFIPADRTQTFFTPTVVNTGAEIVLFDTGLAAEGTLAALTAAGMTPDMVDVVVLTHMHGDHIGGLMGADGVTPTFANARYVTGATEHNYWAGAANEGFDKNVKPLNDRITFLDTNGSVASGITGMDAFGHTPGHMIYQIESDGQRLAITADTANHYVWSLQKPDWEVRFDADKPAAAATRKSVFGMIAADRIPFIGYHMPFPGIGFVEAKDDGFRYVPASYQLMLNG